MAADLSLHPGRYHVGLAASREDVQACQRLRHQCFFNAPGLDADQYTAQNCLKSASSLRSERTLRWA